MWRELEGDKLEEVLRENFQENIGMGRDIEV
jgi:hypothetical protein